MSIDTEYAVVRFSIERFLPRILGGVAVLMLLGTMPAHADDAAAGVSAPPSEFLPVSQAFVLTTTATDNGVNLHFQVQPHYHLYRQRFHFEAQRADLSVSPTFSRAGEWDDDPNLGRMEIYRNDVDIALKTTGQGQVRIAWQGCADAGLCYPPQSRMIDIPLAAVPTVSTSAVAASVVSPSITPSVPQPTPLHVVAPAADTDGIGLFHTQNKLLILLWLLFLGLGLSFTPCVLPMLPILSSIIARQHTRSAMRGFLLSLAYVLGMASTYAISGLLVGFLGARANLAVWFQQPVVLGIFSLLFVALALSMFGLFELRLPHALQNHFDRLGQKSKGGKYVGSYVMGFFAALVVSPCVSAPLAGVLLYISTTGNALFGGLALFTLALGMGVPLLILGATEGRLLPKAGDWMVRIKIIFGLLLLAVALLLISRILPGPITLLLWAALGTVTAVWLGALEPVKPGVDHLWKGLGVMVLIYSTVLVVGAATGNDDPLKPLARFSATAATHELSFKRIKSLSELDLAVQQAADQHQAVMLDFYADWCVSCKVMARQVFADPRVQQQLAGVVVLQADVTASNPADHALLDHFSLAGPPSIIFFKAGQEQRSLRVEGEMGADEFLQRLSAVHE